jgi:hypothetical protein
MDNVRSVHIVAGEDGFRFPAFFFLKTNNELWAMGNNRRGNLGDDTGLNRNEPIFVISDVANISHLHNGTIFAYRMDGSRWSWGNGVFAPVMVNAWYNPNELLFSEHILSRHGNPEVHPMIELSDEIVNSLGGRDNIVSSLRIGGTRDSLGHFIPARYYALTRDSVLWGWGHNDGRLGDGTRATRDRPVRITENVRRLTQTHFITHANDWYHYSGSNYVPSLAFQNVRYLWSRGSGNIGGIWFTPEGQLVFTRRTLFPPFRYELQVSVGDIKLPNIVSAFAPATDLPTTQDGLSGWILESGYWFYYENGLRQTGWLLIGGSWYLFLGTGEMATGWQFVGDHWYWFDLASGDMATGTISINGELHEFAASGEWIRAIP